jgi:hypothetical protein
MLRTIIAALFLTVMKAMLEHEPPPGIICYPVEDDCTHLEARKESVILSLFFILYSS